jgi:hypothetical protein
MGGGKASIPDAVDPINRPRASSPGSGHMTSQDCTDQSTQDVSPVIIPLQSQLQAARCSMVDEALEGVSFQPPTAPLLQRTCS